MKSDRLLSILLLLQSRGRLPAAELAGRLEVSTRTIYRDVESLSAAGVPVYAERGRHGGISLLAGFRTDVTGLTSDEARALFVLLAHGTHSALGLDRALGSALRKIMAALPAAHRPLAELTSRRILVDPDRWLTGPQPDWGLDVLHTAVFTDRRVRLRYRHSGQTRLHTYTVDPYGLVSKAGTWYLVADLRGRPRLFRADRAAEATVVDEPVRRREGVELADAWEALRRQIEERPLTVRVRARVRWSRMDMLVRIAGSAFVGEVRPGEAPPGEPAPGGVPPGDRRPGETPSEQAPSGQAPGLPGGPSPDDPSSDGPPLDGPPPDGLPLAAAETPAADTAATRAGATQAGATATPATYAGAAYGVAADTAANAPRRAGAYATGCTAARVDPYPARYARTHAGPAHSGAAAGGPTTDTDPAPAAGQDPEGGPEAEWTVVELAYRNVEAVWQLLQFGPDVEVLGPAEVRAELAAVAVTMAGLYGAWQPHQAGTGTEPQDRGTGQGAHEGAGHQVHSRQT